VITPLKWRNDLLETLHLLKPADGCGGGLDVCLLRCEVLVVLIHFLLRHGIGFD
jgi:hypothetical protein